MLLTQVKSVVGGNCSKEKCLGARGKMKLAGKESEDCSRAVCIWLPSRQDLGWVGCIPKSKALKGGIPTSA